MKSINNMVAPRDNNRVTALLAASNADPNKIIEIHGDSVTNRLLVDATTEQSGHGTVGDGTRTVTTAGTRVQLSTSSVPCKRVFIEAHESNTGTILVGSSTVVAALSGRRGASLFPTQGDWFNVSNLNLIYIDATVNGGIVIFYYEN